MKSQNWMVGLSSDDNHQPGYKWIAEHPDVGEFYFATKREAEKYVRDHVADVKRGREHGPGTSRE